MTGRFTIDMSGELMWRLCSLRFTYEREKKPCRLCACVCRCVIFISFFITYISADITVIGFIIFFIIFKEGSCLLLVNPPAHPAKRQRLEPDEVEHSVQEDGGSAEQLCILSIG